MAAGKTFVVNNRVLSASAEKPGTEARPNVIVILADDLGYGDTSLFDGWVKKPQLERTAAEGLTFTDFHANSSVCSPTRAAFLTGRYQQRVGIVDVVARHLDTPGLEPSELTIPRLMKQNGYRTALFGKWHLGTEPKYNPTHHGFDEFVGYLDGSAENHFRWWYRWATHSRLPPMIEKAKMLKSHLANIPTYLKHRITNAASESINAKIQWVKYTARGFRNFDNFKNAIYFHCGDLDLSPQPT